MSDLNVFDFGEHAVRVSQSDKGEPLFVAKDVCAVLDISNSRDTLAKGLDEDEKGVANIYTLGGSQQMQVVTESGLYHLIFKSRKEEAKKFRRWVTSEVLPTLRKRGVFDARRDAGVKLSLPEWVKGHGFLLKEDYATIMPMMKRAWVVAGMMGMKPKELNERGFLMFDADVLDAAEGGVSGELNLEDSANDALVELMFERMELGELYSVGDLASLLGMEGSEPRLRTDVGSLVKPVVGKVRDGRKLERLTLERKVLFKMVEVVL